MVGLMDRYRAYCPSSTNLYLHYRHWTHTQRTRQRIGTSGCTNVGEASRICGRFERWSPREYQASGMGGLKARVTGYAILLPLNLQVNVGPSP